VFLPIYPRANALKRWIGLNRLEISPGSPGLVVPPLTSSMFNETLVEAWAVLGEFF
jgi:hypothetical protein